MWRNSLRVLSVIFSVGESFGLRWFSKPAPLPECFGYKNEHEPNHALQVMFLKDLPLRRCPGEYWDLPVCLVRVGHSNQPGR